MTVKELKILLEQLSFSKEDYIITTEAGYKEFDGELFVIDNLKKVVIE